MSNRQEVLKFFDKAYVQKTIRTVFIRDARSGQSLGQGSTTSKAWKDARENLIYKTEKVWK